MNIQCKHCYKTFVLDDADLAFYQSLTVPTPRRCPTCREQRRAIFRNERNYYQRQCDLCTKKIISVYQSDVAFPVYCMQCWWSDQWDASSYAREIDWSRPFFPQYKELLNTVPHLAMMNDDGFHSENCAYTYDFSMGKNAYMVIASWYVEDSMYGFQINHVKEVYDSLFVFESELIYEGAVVEKSYHCANVTLVNNCRDIDFGYDLQNCSDCIGCAGLRNKQYCIWNKQYTADEYSQRKQALGLDQYSKREEFKQDFQRFILQTPRRYANLVKCENTTGDNLIQCANTRDSYLFNGLVNCRYCSKGDKAKDCYDINNSGNPELCYESVTPDESYHNLFTVFCWKSQFVSYSENCHSSNELFGCVGMKKGKYAILNKTYSDKEYSSLKERLIAHMKTTGEYGEFFPMSLSPFAYNETPAQIIEPLQSASAEQLGVHWQEQLPGVVGKQTITEIPNQIGETTDTVLKEILGCQHCGRNYKIQTAELNFYRKLAVPLPHCCVECRYLERLQRINPQQLWHRQCMCTQIDHSHKGLCTIEFDTTYSPDHKEIVYCESCYQKEIY